MSTKRLDGDRSLSILGKYRYPIWRVGTVPLLRYLRDYPDQSIHSLRSRASILNDLMVFQGRKDLDIPGKIKPIEVPQPYTRTMFLVENQILLRVKMMDESGHTSNVRTKFIKDYENDLELPGIPPRPHRMTLGYVLSPMQTSVSRVMVASHIGRTMEFYIDFYVPQGKVISINEAENLTAENSTASTQVMIRLIRQRLLGESNGGI